MTSPLTPADAITTILHSSLPTVLTEGADDYTVFRKMEERLSDLGVSFLPLKGRDSVLEVWYNLPFEAHRKTAFFVDRDSWIYAGVPAQYVKPEILMTTGYSIENDVFIDGHLLDLCTPTEAAAFAAEVDSICRWHAPRVAAIAMGAAEQIRDHPTAILNRGLEDCSQWSPYITQWYEDLKENYAVILRGKTVLQLLVRQLSASGRRARHSYNTLLETGALQRGQHMTTVENALRQFFV